MATAGAVQAKSFRSASAPGLDEAGFWPVISWMGRGSSSGASGIEDRSQRDRHPLPPDHGRPIHRRGHRGVQGAVIRKELAQTPAPAGRCRAGAAPWPATAGQRWHCRGAAIGSTVRAAA
jgi:hypothetical protein